MLRSSQERRREIIKLGKRKARDLDDDMAASASGSCKRARRDERERSITSGIDAENSGFQRDDRARSGSRKSPLQRRVIGKGKAIRGGLGGRF